MAFDMGFNFRGTAGYVTDGAEGVPVLAESYSHTYTNGNGDSINAGWNPNGVVAGNVASGNDPRIAGYNYEANNSGTHSIFVVDLSSGSAPGAGNYTVDIAEGDASAGQTVEFKLFDNTTLLIDGTNGGSFYATGGAGKFLDASLAIATASTSWTGTTVSQTFASTTAKLQIAPISGAGFSTLAHFRLTKQEGSTYTLTAAAGAFTL